MAQLKTRTLDMAKNIYIATIQAHHTHGLGHDKNGHTLKLDFEQVAGESIEAALMFEMKLQMEEDAGQVSRVMYLNREYRIGYGKAISGQAVEIPDRELTEMEQAFFDGYSRGLSERV